MTPKIKDLAEKAGMGRLQHVGSGEWEVFLKNREVQFIETLIRECAALALTHQNSDGPNSKITAEESMMSVDEFILTRMGIKHEIGIQIP